MITHIEIENFKSFERVSLDLGGLNIFIGTNASGKSNVFDALRVLQGIGYGFTVDEIFNGKPKSAASEVWKGIRGGIEHASFRGREQSLGRDRVRSKVTLTGKKPDVPLTYEIDIDLSAHVIEQEALTAGNGAVFQSLVKDSGYGSNTIQAAFTNVQGRSETGMFMSPWSILKQFSTRPEAARRDRDNVELCTRLLCDLQPLDLLLDNLRDYGLFTPRMGDRGENFAGLVQSIVKDPLRCEDYLSWLKELTPSELDEVVPRTGAKDDFLFAVKHHGQSIPATVLSDGTLRFAAITAAFFQPDMPDRILLEEIENGLHPTRLRLLIELLKSQTANGFPQVIATTHSPLVLDWLKEDDFRHCFLFRKDEETGASTVTPLSSVPRFMDLIRKQSASELFAEGWLEGAA